MVRLDCDGQVLVFGPVGAGRGVPGLVTKCGTQCVFGRMWPRVQPPPSVSPVKTVRGLRPQTRPLMRRERILYNRHIWGTIKNAAGKIFIKTMAPVLEYYHYGL